MLSILDPATTNDLTILATLKTELGITDTASDAYLADLIRQASDTVTRYCGRATFNRETVQQTERLTCRRECIVLDRDILPAITSVTEGGTALTADEYELDGSLLYRLCGDVRICWAACKVVIVYAAGYVSLTDVPYDLERAVLITAAAWHSAKGRDPMLRSETTEGVGATSWIATAGMAAMPPQAVSILDVGPYRLYAIG